MISTYRQMTHAICRRLEHIKTCQSGSGSVLVVLGARVSVLTPINSCHFNANSAWTSKMFVLVKVKWERLTSTIQFNMWTLSKIWRNFSRILCGLEIWDSLHTPNARWLAYCDLHNLARELWRCSTIDFPPCSGSHKLSAHFPGESDWSKVFFQGDRPSGGALY